MRNSTGGTTSAKKSQNNASNNSEKNSAKKLVQARLPFKVIAPGPTSAAAASVSIEEHAGKTEINAADVRKRKLSYTSDGDVEAIELADNVSKENVDLLVLASKKKKIAATNCEVEEVVSLLDDDDEVVDKNADDAKNVPTAATSKEKTPKAIVGKGKRKGAGTPKTTTSSAQKEKGNSASKLTIKLPISAGKKNKRRKSRINSHLANNSSNDITQENTSCADSSDDIEQIASELNPQKRTKLDFEGQEKNAEGTKKENIGAICLDTDSEKEENYSSTTSVENRIKSPKKSNTKCASNSRNIESIKNSQEVKGSNSSQGSGKNYTTDSSDAEECEKHGGNDMEEQNESIIIASDDDDDDVDADVDADDETENTANKQINVSSDANEDINSKHNTTIETRKSSENSKSDKHKLLTPKQIKLTEQRQKAREEKERKLLEEKKKKQQEKEEKELAKKREREEKEDQKRKEREDKEEQKRKEREEKERKRLAEIEAKNEEKRKRNEAKEEELRKKDEERKRKELEKEEAVIKIKKAAEAFTKFFVAKVPSITHQNIDEDENTGDGIATLAFRPFQIKGDMKLAPLCRKTITNDAKYRLESLIGCRHKSNDDINKMEEGASDDEIIVRTKPLPKSKLYLSELKSGKIMPGKWRRPSTESKDDVVIIEDELERVGQAIVEDTPAYIREEMRVKFYKFHDNRRPPYYGTFRKKSSVVSGRKPFVQDKKFFDYEVDSDDEWEEEEPGESLEDASEDDKEKESEDEDYEVDNEWFVPHGHLSDEELQNEDELGNGDDNTREAQKAKLQILQQEFAQEMKKKTEKIKPRLIGCIWADKNGNQPLECPKIIWETLGLRSILYNEPPVVDEPQIEEPSSPSASNGPSSEKSGNDKLKPIVINDGMVKDLVRLVHGNNHSKNFLIKEYLAYVENTEESVKKGEFANPQKSAIREKIERIAEWQAVSASAATANSVDKIDDSSENANKKKKTKKRLCWVVHQNVLDSMNMASLHLQNSWEYILKPKLKSKIDEVAEPVNDVISKTEKIDDKTITESPQITKFTKVLTAEEKAKKLHTTTSTRSSNIVAKDKAKGDIKVKSPVANTQAPKEKKRVPLLMSVARGQQIPTPAKNKLISQFLQKGRRDSNCPGSTKVISKTSDVVNDDDDVVLLD